MKLSAVTVHGNRAIKILSLFSLLIYAGKDLVGTFYFAYKYLRQLPSQDKETEHLYLTGICQIRNTEPEGNGFTPRKELCPSLSKLLMCGWSEGREEVVAGFSS